MGVIVRLRGVLGLEVDVRMVGVALLGVAVLVPVAKPQVLEDTAVLEEIVRHVVVVVPMCHGLMARENRENRENGGSRWHRGRRGSTRSLGPRLWQSGCW
jgi:hypothetical protein